MEFKIGDLVTLKKHDGRGPLPGDVGVVEPSGLSISNNSVLVKWRIKRRGMWGVDKDQYYVSTYNLKPAKPQILKNILNATEGV